LNSILIRAVIVVTFALLFYSIGVIMEQRKHFISKAVLTFLTAGVILDISSTALMIIGSRKIPITVHGFIGYSALTVMLIDTILVWRFWRSHGNDQVSPGLNRYTRIAYIWWVVAYIAGATIAMVLERG
jgi:EamA domain-containing membrane protein RarD